MSRTFKAMRVRFFSCVAACWLLAGCGAGPHPAAPPPCDQACQDGVALRGARAMMKLAFNTVVMGKPTGDQDAQTKCLPLSGPAGSVHVFGTAMSNADQGDSSVDLSYDFKNCSYAAPPDPTADQNYSVTLTGLVTESGAISVQPTSTTALLIESDSLTISGTVYDPPLDYTATDCALAVNQNGNGLAGTLCGRNAGFTF